MTFLYQINDMKKALLTPTHLWAEMGEAFFKNPFSPLTYTIPGKTVSAALEVLERATRDFRKPAFGIDAVKVPRHGDVSISQENIIEKTFCHLIHFRKEKEIEQPKVLVCAPLSGHYATLLRDTVKNLLEEHDVYITDWQNSRDISALFGPFTLDDYIDYVLEFMRFFEGNCHVIGVCQPAVPVLAAVSLLAELQDPAQPKSMTLIGGPIDTRLNPTKANLAALERPLSWFDQNILTTIPIYYPGFMRRVCPGFLMLTGFMSLHMDRHIAAQSSLFEHLVDGDQSSVEAHIKFYDEYLSVMDIPGEYFLDSIRVAFQEHLLPKGEMMWREVLVNPQAITKTALLTVEGERDDISGVGQTQAAHQLCVNLPPEKHQHHLQKDVGHYGLFNGGRWRKFVLPKIHAFILKNDFLQIKR